MRPRGRGPVASATITTAAAVSSQLVSIPSTSTGSVITGSLSRGTSAAAAEIGEDGTHVARELALRLEGEVAAVGLERVGLPSHALVGGTEEQLGAGAARVERRRLLQRAKRAPRIVGLEQRVAERQQRRDGLAVDLHRLAKLLRGGAIPAALEQRLAFLQGAGVFVGGGRPRGRGARLRRSRRRGRRSGGRFRLDGRCSR